MSAAAGVICLAKPGERVTAGQPVLELRAQDPGLLEAGREALATAIEIGPEPPPAAPLVIERITGSGPVATAGDQAGIHRGLGRSLMEG